MLGGILTSIDEYFFFFILEKAMTAYYVKHLLNVNFFVSTNSKCTHGTKL